MDLLETVEAELNLPSSVEIERSGGIVELHSDSFNKVPATGESPDVIYISESETALDVRPVGSGGERMEVMPSEAVSYIEKMFL
jgi:hypothetical protein